MSTSVRSFAKINLGLKIGSLRPDQFHELRTIYQTIALHDVIRIEVQRGSGIEIRCDEPAVPLNESNTCYRISQRVMNAAKANGHVVIEIEKYLPVQGGLGAASSNAVATMLALERELGIALPRDEKLRIAAEVGSDLPLFVIGGTVLGVGRGEKVHPFDDVSPMHMVLVTPAIGVSTPKAFAQWDALVARDPELTGSRSTGTINEFSGAVSAWLSESPTSGVPASGGDRAETPLLDLVRAGIENDFERVVFPEYPELREVKRVLEREGAQYASLSGSGSTVYGVFASSDEAAAVADRISAKGHKAVPTRSLSRKQYWEELFV